MTQSGDIKRVASKTFKVQRKNGKGVKSEDEAILDTISTNTIDTLMVFTNKGKMYKLLVDNVPIGTNASKGVRINTLINMEPNEKVSAITSLYRQTNAEYAIFITKKGLIKKTYLSEYMKVKRGSGIAAINIKEDDEICNVTFLKDEEMIIVTKNGMAIHFPTEDITPIGRIAAGVKAIKLSDDDEVLIGIPVHQNWDTLSIFTQKGYGKRITLQELPIQKRAGKGVAIYKPTNISGNIIGATMLEDNDNVLLIGKPNSICISSKDVPVLGRNSIGNIMIKNSQIISVVKL